jgi:hypothetical protein
MVAWIVIVTDPSLGIEPFHLAVFELRLAVAVPLLAEAETNDKLAGNTSLNSLPGLLNCAAGPVLCSTMV